MPHPDLAPHRTGPSARTLSPETAGEADYERCVAEIASKRRRIDEMEGDLAKVRAALAQFELVCQANIGDLINDLRHVAEAIERYVLRLRRLRAEIAGDDGLLADLPDPDLLPPIGEDDPEAEAQIPTEEELPIRPAADLGEDGEELRRLYRDLAKRCHPDFARDEEDRERRLERMLAINEAYDRRDVEALRALRHQVEAEDPAFDQRPVGERFVWALTEVGRLDARIAGLRAEWLSLRRSDIHKLWRRHEAGEPVFEDLREQLEAHLAQEADRLDDAIAAWRDLADEHPELAGASAGALGDRLDPR